MIKIFRQIRKDLMETGKTGKYFKYAIGEIVLVVIGILIALSINNWNQERISKKESQSKLNLVHRELIEDIRALENEVNNRYKKSQLMSRALHIIEVETSLSTRNRQVLDSAFLIYKRMEPLFNNTTSYEILLSTESDFVDDEIYSKLNKYLDTYNETNARIERFGHTVMHPDFNIVVNSSVKKRSSGEYEYSFKTIKQDDYLYEIIRHSQQAFQAISAFYSDVLEKAKDLENKIQNE